MNQHVDYRPYGLAKLMLIGCSAVAFLSIGVFGGGIFGGAPWTRASISGRIAKVFAAAPLNSKRVVPEKWQSTREYDPPAYVKVASEKKQPLHFMPSNCCETPKNFEPSTEALKGGTIGSPGNPPPPWADATCSKVDAWFPESMKNMQQAPTINDPNAIVTLDITPPSGQTNEECCVWVYHYGDPPHEFKRKNKAIRRPVLEVSRGDW